MSCELYEKVEKICQKIDAYTEKDLSVKSEIKIKSYSTKIKTLINMIEEVEPIAQSTNINEEEIINENQVNDNNKLEEKYNPYSEEFCYKDRLKQLNGNIYRLIQELKEQDKEGYRNAYIINEIEKYIPSKANIKVREKKSLWQKIKSFFKK